MINISNNRLIAGTLLALMMVFSLAGCSDSTQETQSGKDQAVEISGQPTAVSSLLLTLNTQYPSRSFYTGRIESFRSSDLGFELGGMLNSVEVEEGDRVSKGDVLATLDTQRLRAQLKEARAGVAQAEAQSSLARSTLDRLIEAREFDGVSSQQLDEAQNAFDSSAAAVLAAKSRLSRVNVDINKAKLVAPYDASILRRHFDEGQVLAPGQAVLSVQEWARLKARVGVAGLASQQLDPGSEYTLIVNGNPVRAVLRSILPVRDSVARTVDALFDIELGSAAGGASEQSDFVKAGDLAQLELRRVVEAEGYWVPLTALAEGERGLWNVYVLARALQLDQNSTHVIESRAVEVLYQDGVRAYVNGALNPDERIVPSGLNRVVPGQQVVMQQEGS